MNYYIKYIKYKNKYLELKKSRINLIGGDLPIINNFNEINLFNIDNNNYQCMEKYLNPIYGLVMVESGYVINNYYLHKSKFINTKDSKIIVNITKDIPGNVQPNNDLMKLKPIDYGRYIVIKYIYMIDNSFFTISEKGKINFNPKLKIDKYDNDILQEFIIKIRKYIKLQDIDKICFHIILYCLWWVANNDEGISQYYDGINEVFGIVNKYLPFEKKINLIDKTITSNSDFEKILIQITHKSFKIFNQEWAKHFCPESQFELKSESELELESEKTNKKTYPDCGEVTARNFINLLIFDKKTFNIDLLQKLGAISQLIEYYNVFNNFEKQTETNNLFNIFNDKLNARDAWSKLIIFYANTNNNLNLIKSCGINNKFELNAGMNLNKTQTNFFQLIKNLLTGINSWKDLENNFIDEISDKTIDGVGDIFINHKEFGEIIIKCETGHYYMKIIKPNEIINSNFNNFTQNQQKIIKILNFDNEFAMSHTNVEKFAKSLTLDNYLWYNYNIEQLDYCLNSFTNMINIDVINKLIDLIFTDKFDSDSRRRMMINVDRNYFKLIIQNHSNDNKINDFTFVSNNLNFIYNFPNLKHLNFYCGNIFTDSLNLSPLSNIISIGNDFLSGGESRLFHAKDKLTEINLMPLSNVKIIENNFLKNRKHIQNIILPSLYNLQSIGDNFLYDCRSLTQIDFSGSQNLQTIGDNFLFDCISLTQINLSELTNLQSIGNWFLHGCKSLKQIDLSGLTKLETIGENFMVGCEKSLIIKYTKEQEKLFYNNKHINNNFYTIIIV